MTIDDLMRPYVYLFSLLFLVFVLWLCVESNKVQERCANIGPEWKPDGQYCINSSGEIRKF